MNRLSFKDKCICGLCLLVLALCVSHLAQYPGIKLAYMRTAYGLEDFVVKQQIRGDNRNVTSTENGNNASSVTQGSKRNVAPMKNHENTPGSSKVNKSSQKVNQAKMVNVSLNKSGSLNIGELLRKDQDVPPVIPIETLRKNNRCPQQYNFPNEILKEFKNIKEVSQFSLKGRKQNFNKKVVILSPVSNYEKRIFHYFKLLCSLSYPHNLISVVLGEDSSSDNTYRDASTHAKQLSPYFRNVSVHHFDLKMPHNPFGGGKHTEGYQRMRRAHLAKSRNQLLFKGIGDADVVLWIDVDVKYVPKDLIQHLLSADKPILVPSCVYKTGSGVLDVYDRNTWKETAKSLEFAQKLKEEDLRLEGYRDTLRTYLPRIEASEATVRIDGVGGCVLMISADAHRQGLVFPTFVFKNHIETEGLAQMATKMNIGIFGFPNLFVVHW